MVSMSTKKAFDKAISLLYDSDTESIPRLVIVNSDVKASINKAIDMDRNIFKSDSFILTCQRGEEFETIQLKGSLNLTLHNILASAGYAKNMILTVENVISKFVKGHKVERTIKLIYVVISRDEEDVKE